MFKFYITDRALLDRVEVNGVVRFHTSTAAPPADTLLEYTSEVPAPQHVYPRINNFGQQHCC